MDLTTLNNCPREDIAAYIDGELTDEQSVIFEKHLKSCADCGAELSTQRQLLCTLDVAFNGTRAIELPRDFPRVVAAHAESDLRGMRRKSERWRAIKLCGVLALLSFALLGAAARTLVFEPVRSLLRIAESLIDLAWRTTYDVGTGTMVITRVVARAIVSGPNSLGLFLLLAFVVSVSLLPLLIARYHRAQI